MTIPVFKTRRDLYILPLCAILNIVTVMILFSVCRVIFFVENISAFSELSEEGLWNIFTAGLIFDVSAVLYTNLLYVAMALLPLPWKDRKWYRSTLKGIFTVTNILALFANIADTVYYPFANRRTTFSFFKEFGGEDNLGEIFWAEVANHWYLAVICVAMGLFVYFCYLAPESKIWGSKSRKGMRGAPVTDTVYCLTHLLILAVLAYPIVGGLRGGFGRQVRPITISNANRYVNRPAEAAIVLNTPFSIYQTIGVESFPVPDYFSGEEREEMTEIYTPVHRPSSPDGDMFKPLNVVVLIMESFGREYSGYLNGDIPGYSGYMPFLDSLMREGLTYKYSFSNGHKSIDGMPSVLSGIPMFVEPFFLTSYSMNDVTSIGGELVGKGYYTAFFHGAKNGSMGFEAYARACGYRDYFGRTEYEQWLGHDDDEDYDGFWGIWDEQFLQFFADKMSSFSEPFCTGLFSVSSHHPFRIPDKYAGKFPEGNEPIHKCIGYSDYALRRFFETASRTSWYDHTLFVITGDHTNQTYLPEYKNDAGQFAVPVVFYCPGAVPADTSSCEADAGCPGLLHGFVTDAVAQQADIMPTVLGYLGYDRPFVSFGCDLLNTSAGETYAANYNNGIYQFFKGDYMLQFDGSRSVALYEFRKDVFLKHNLLGQHEEVREEMEKEIRSIIQQYMERMNQNGLVLR